MGPIPVMGSPVPTGFAHMSLAIAELAGTLTSENGKTETGIASST
jgi:hypothetical protein